MKKLNLGKSDLKVTVLGLGCMNFGSLIDERTSFELMDAYVENSGNFFDTANNYVFWESGFFGGESEKTIGNWLSYSGRRKDIVLATKLGAMPKILGSNDFTQMQGLGRSIIYEEVEKSLYNLKTDYIDLLYLHVDDYATPQEETLGALNELVSKGWIREIGCSNFRTWRVESARNVCEKYNYKFFCAIQQRYSYLQPVIDADFAPQVVADVGLLRYIEYYKDLTLVAHTPLLYGVYNKDGVIDMVEYDTYSNRKRLRQLLDNEKNPNSYVLKYITEQFGGSVSLFTTSKKEHLLENMRYFEQ